MGKNVVVPFCRTRCRNELECGPMPNGMVALPNIGGALCSTPQRFGWRPLLECHAVTLPRRESRWNLQGCPKLANGSQPLVGRSSPYYEQFNTPVGWITHNIVHIKSKRKNNYRRHVWTIKPCRMSATTLLYNINTDRTSSLAWEWMRKHQKILHSNGLVDNIICL